MNTLQKAWGAVRRADRHRTRSNVGGSANGAIFGRLFTRGVAAAGAAAMAAMIGANPADATDLSRQAPPLFGVASAANSDLSPFVKWTQVLDAFQSEHVRMYQPCQQGESCKLQQWAGFIQSLRGHDRWTQIVEVHRRMNSAYYIEDIDNYGNTDYWATPGQFFDRSGDCEDYAIAKFMTLRELGFTNEQMRIAVVHDTNLDLVHAVLIVYHQDVAYLLDNQIDQVVRVDSVHHYRPYYSLNETLWWRHT